MVTPPITQRRGDGFNDRAPDRRLGAWVCYAVFGGFTMAQFTNRDKLIIMQEQAMWIVANILREEASSVDHTWQARIRKLSEESRQIAQELRDYNEQFEEEDDE